MIERRLWQFATIAAGTGSALLARRAATTVWRSTRHEEPPQHPTDRNVGWGDAMVWAVSVAVGAAVARVVAERGAAAAWTAATGSPPPDSAE